MTIPWIRLAGWGLLISGVAVFANSPREVSLPGTLWQAGLPFIYAAGMGETTSAWHPEILWTNIALWIAAYLLVAALITISFSTPATEKDDKAG